MNTGLPVEQLLLSGESKLNDSFNGDGPASNSWKERPLEADVLIEVEVVGAVRRDEFRNPVVELYSSKRVRFEDDDH